MALSDDLAAAVVAAGKLESALADVTTALDQSNEAAARLVVERDAVAAEFAAYRLANPAPVVVPEPEPEPVPAPDYQVKNVRHASQTATGFVAAWDSVEAATGYEVYRNVEEDGTGGWRQGVKAAPQTTQGFPNLAPGTTVRVAVSAVVDGVVQARSEPVVLEPAVAAPTEPPVTVEPKPATRKASLHPFSSAAFSNTPIGSGATFVDEPALRVNGANVNCERWSFPVFVAKDTDTTYKVGGYDVRIPATAEASAGTDQHMNVYQADGRTSYEMWGAQRTSTGWTARYVVRTDTLGEGMGAGARASGVSHLHGVIRPEELLRGEILHTLCIAADNAQLKSVGPWGSDKRGYGVWPARRQDGDGTTAYKGPIEMGAMFAIPPSVDITKLGITSKAGLALARACQDFGGHILVRAAGTNLFAETTCAVKAPQELKDIRAAWQILRGHMRKVTNNTATNVGGGGTRRHEPLPEVIAG